MDAEEYSLDALFSDLPRIHQLRFFTTSSLDLSPECVEVVGMLNDLTTSDTSFTDEEGYVWEVIASVIDENNKRIAWVEWREKESGRTTYTDYYLKARDDSGALLVWEI